MTTGNVRGPGRCVVGGYREVCDKGVREEVSVNNHGVCSRETYI